MVDPNESLQVDTKHVRQLADQLSVGCVNAFTLMLVILNYSFLEIAIETLLQVVTVSRDFQIDHIERFMLNVGLLGRIN
jgi:hypothetical protein